MTHPQPPATPRPRVSAADILRHAAAARVPLHPGALGDTSGPAEPDRVVPATTRT